MPQHVTLSNGHKLDIPDGLTNDQITDRVNQMESLINPQWKGFGSLSDTGETMRNVMSYVTNPAERIATAALDLNPYIGGLDLGIGGVNALKSVASKYYTPLRDTPDIPTVSGTVGRIASTPELPADAPGWQRYAEAAATGVLNPKKWVSTAARMVGGTAGGDIGGEIAGYFDPYWEKAGRWLGSYAGATPDVVVPGARTTVQKLTAGPQAQEVAAAGDQLNTQPTFGSLAGQGGRLAEKGLAAIPFVNLPINAARTRMEEAIRNARESSAEQINQGSLQPSDPNSIGGNLITQARTRSASIKADASQRFEDLYQAVPHDTLVNARPVIQAIKAQANSPNVSGAQKAELLARRDYLISMTYGQPGYNGPVFGPGATPVGAIPLGQLARFKSELGEDIQSMSGIDQNASQPVYNAIDNSLQAAFNRAGYGPQYQQARDNYAQNIGPGTVTDKLDAVGGRPVRGKPGIYEGGMNEGQAHGFLARNLQSPSALEPFVDANSPYWRAAASSFINTLGQGPQGDFRGDIYSKQAGKISDPVLTQLTQGPSGGTQQAAADLRAAQTLGQESSVPVSRHGLTSSIGSFAAIEALMSYMGEHFANAGLPAALAIPTAMAASYGLQSKPMTDAMSGRGTTSLVDALYTGAPYAAASQNLNNPDQPSPLGWSVTPAPPSPLDTLRTPQP